MRRPPLSFSAFIRATGFSLICVAVSAILTPVLLAQNNGNAGQAGGVQPMAALSVNYYTPCSSEWGDLISIYGSYFGSSQGSGYVVFTGVSTHASIQYWSDTLIQANVPSGASNGPITVYGYGGHASGTQSWLKGYPAVSPTSGLVGTGVTTTKACFTPSSVTFNGVAASYSYTNYTVSTSVPTNATTGSLVVSGSYGGYNYSDSWPFTVNPQITSLSVTSGPRGTAFTISGSGFGTSQGSNAVTVGGATASVTSWGASSIATSVPNSAPIGSDNVIVTANSVASNSATFAVKGTATVTLGNLTQTYAGSGLCPSATTSPSGLNITWSGCPDTNAGTYNSITATVNDPNYQGSASGTFTINPAPLTITASSAIMPYGGPVPTITPIYSGWVGGQGPSNLTTQPTCSTTATTTSPMGTYTSTCQSAADSNYTITYVNGVVTVTGKFVTTGSLSTERYSHNATLLNNGKVLISGGGDDNDYGVPGAQLYDPSIGVFTTISTTLPGWCAAALLDDGRVLLAGGVQAPGPNQIAIASAQIYDPATGTLTPTGSMNVARGQAMATLLSNGLVLITGGWGMDGRSELYNPATGTFSMTANNMSTGREYYNSAVLADGRVLFAGGFANGHPVSSAEIYNPATGLFAPTGSLNTARGNQTATLLDNGKVLETGGWDVNGNPLQSAEIFDPNANGGAGAFTYTGNMTTIRAGSAAALLTNGQVLVVGSGADAEVYDPVVGTFSATSNPSYSRAVPMATLLNDGWVLISGGLDQVIAELYQTGDPAPPTLTSITLTPQNPSTVVGGAQQFVAQDQNGQILQSVAWTSSANSVATISNTGEAYGLTAGQTNIQACDGSVCSAPTILTVGKGTATVTLGNLIQNYTGNPLTPSATTNPAGLNIVWTGAPQTNVGSYAVTATVNDPNYQGSASGTFVITTFVLTGSLSAARSSANAKLLDNGQVLVTSGMNDWNMVPNAELYDPGAGSFSTIITDNLVGSSETLLANGKVLVAGGADNNETPYATAKLYDPTTASFTPTGSLNTARSAHSATLLENGKVLMAGGADASAELYDPATGTFAPTGSLNTARNSHMAVMLNDGKVLIAGGWIDGYNTTASAELYDPAAGTFTPTGSMNLSRGNTSAVLLNGGKVFIAGGCCGSAVMTSADVYDPAAGTFTLINGLTGGSDLSTLTLLSDGAVLIAGGWSVNPYAPSSNAWLYDPSAGTFTATNNLNTTRAGAAAVRLNDGTVLIVGGRDANGNLLNSAELYEMGTPPPPGLVSLTVNPQSPSITVGGAQQFVAQDQNGQILQSVTWTSSAHNVAIISNTGVAYGLTSGQASIQACDGPVCSQFVTLAVIGGTPTTTSLSSSLNPSMFGQGVSFTALVNTGGGAPSGTVSFADSGAGIGSGGVTSVSTTNLVPYSQQFTTSPWWGYCGSNSNVTTNTSDVPAPDGTQTATKLVMPSSFSCNSGVSFGVGSNIPNGLTPGQTYTASIWLRGASGGESVTLDINDSYTTVATLTTSWQRYTATFFAIASTGQNNRGFEVFSNTANATYYIWGAQTELSSTVGPYVLTGASALAGYGGAAVFTTSQLMAGTHSITAAYAGDGTYAPGSSPPYVQTVNKALAEVDLSNLTQPYTGNPLCPNATTKNPAGLNISWTGCPDTNAGSYPVTATVNDPNYQGSASGSFTITGEGPSVSLASSSPTSAFRSAVTFTATVSSTGSVTFMDGNTTLAANIQVTSGTAAYTTTTLAPGSHVIKAIYTDSNQNTASATIGQTVSKPSITLPPWGQHLVQ